MPEKDPERQDEEPPVQTAGSGVAPPEPERPSAGDVPGVNGDQPPAHEPTSAGGTPPADARAAEAAERNGGEPPPPAAEPMSLVNLREYTTAGIAIAITVVALGLLIFAFFSIDQPSITANEVSNADLFQAQVEARDTTFRNRMIVVNLGIGLLGVVTGYFFGRIPAERRAERAEAAGRQSVEAAETHAAQAAAANVAKDQAEREQASTEAQLDAFRQETLATVNAAKQRMRPTVQRATTLAAGQGLETADKENLIAATTELDALERRLGA